ncbi:hypothetical protein B7494_g280 [Chlorociboria aeruginascens]|nr:hypothetical protein B7494_g280 [Chlorociboria aeruginascens]
MSKLFTPLKVGANTLQHRVVMAPLTRHRADDDHVPLPMVAEYYSQRASVRGTLLISEATLISPRAGGYENVPGIWSAAQIQSWKKVTDAVHQKQSFIYLQLWNLGRAASPAVLEPEGFKVVGASAIPIDAEHAVPTPLTEDEIHGFIADYAQAAKNAIEAGFDGVEIHGANGYLIDQFLQDVTNKRTDAWGGSIEKRARFAVEVAQAVVGAVGASRTAMRLSPWSRFQSMGMADPVPQFSYLVEELKKLPLAYLHVVESRAQGNMSFERTELVQFMAKIWGKTSPLFIAGGLTPDLARKAVDEEFVENDAAAVFGRHFLANPDLPFRIQKGIELAPHDRSTFYTPMSPKGYLDYPFSKEFLAAST